MKSSDIDKKLITGEDWNSYFRKTYGDKNVTWENPVNSIDEIIDTPSLVTRFQPKQLAEFAEESGWKVGPLKNGRNSVSVKKFTYFNYISLMIK